MHVWPPIFPQKSTLGHAVRAAAYALSVRLDVRRSSRAADLTRGIIRGITVDIAGVHQERVVAVSHVEDGKGRGAAIPCRGLERGRYGRLARSP